MLRNFNWSALPGMIHTQGSRFWLRTVVLVLALANAAALLFYIAPPGGTRKELTEQVEQARRQIVSARMGATRLKNVTGKVQSGSAEATAFQAQNFLGKRAAYDAVISEIQRMAKASGIQEREGVFSEEPIEGSADLSLLNVTSSYQGTYDNLLRFLYESDKSPMLLMLDTLQAVPQQHGGQINASIRFQAIVKEEFAGRTPGGPR
jgi:hypothetical protein